MDQAQPPSSQFMSRRLVLMGGVALAGTGGGWWALYRYRPSHSGAYLTVQQAHTQALAGEILLVDIRTPNEWRHTGLPEGAVPLDMRRADFLTVLADLTEGQKDAPIALICAGGVRSARLSRLLIAVGFTHILDVGEGMNGSSAGPGWLNSKLPVTPWTD